MIFQYAAVGCELTSKPVDDSNSLVVLTTQIQFDKGDNSALCRLSIVNNTIYEGKKQFTLSLTSPDKVLLGVGKQAIISLDDPDDGRSCDLSLYFVYLTAFYF